jgi:hypothetical protein
MVSCSIGAATAGIAPTLAAASDAVLKAAPDAMAKNATVTTATRANLAGTFVSLGQAGYAANGLMDGRVARFSILPCMRRQARRSSTKK